MKKVAEDKPYYQFNIFDKYKGVLRHAVSTSEHGSLDSKDNSDDEAINRRRFGDLVGIPANHWLFSHQVHSDIVHIVDEAVKTPFKFSEGDALITNRSNQALFVKMADCQSILLFDPQQKVVAAVHSGWRGSVKNIIGKTVFKMVDHFGCESGDILVGISYSLGPCCAYFTDPNVELPPEFHGYIAEDKHSVDFWQASIDQLKIAGVKEGNIECARVCTMCEGDEFYSYRRDGDKAGRMGAVICLA